MNPIEKNILKLMQATLGEVEFTDAVQNRISQRLNTKRKEAAIQAFSEQLPLFSEIGLLEKPKPAVETELEVVNCLWDFPPTIVVSEEISSERQIESEKLSPSQLLLPGFESYRYGSFESTQHIADFDFKVGKCLWSESITFDKFYSNCSCSERK